MSNTCSLPDVAGHPSAVPPAFAISPTTSSTVAFARCDDDFRALATISDRDSAPNTLPAPVTIATLPVTLGIAVT
jgi:hypothetical protein